MFQPLVRGHLVRVVGEVIKTMGVQDFRIPEDFGCSIVESPKGPKCQSVRVDPSHWPRKACGSIFLTLEKRHSRENDVRCFENPRSLK
jgi:hypothetical protein